MALNTKGKKTSLTEEASIYQKRQDDLSDKERIKNMTGKQKRDFFRTYYLPKLLVILAVAGVVFYIVWVDFINKSHIYMRCAILNESITDSTLTEFSDRFTDSMKMDYKKNRASFYMYYTRSDVAREMGADTGSDLSEISSRLVANSLDCMIASYEDVENIYLKNGFIMNLNNFLSENEKKALKPYFVTKKNEADKVIGISLKDCKKYRTLFTGRTPITEEPVLYVITNATNEGKNYVKQLIHYLYSDELKQTE
ncbi:MAG: hypothetical protein ACLSV5_02575 [Clostridium sp.]|jgi:hypothetical protein